MEPIREMEKFSSSLLKLILLIVGTGITSSRAIEQELKQKYNQNYDYTLIKRRLEYAAKQQYLKKYGDTKKPHYQLTEAGLNKLDQLKLKSLELATDKWDGRWRIILFDIPENNRLARDRIRKLARNLGLKQLQHSVWITPYDCREQFQQISSAYRLANHLIFLEVLEFDQTDRYKRYWNL